MENRFWIYFPGKLQDISVTRCNVFRIIFATISGWSAVSLFSDSCDDVNDRGLYDNLQRYNLERAEMIFELDFFKRSPGALPSDWSPIAVGDASRLKLQSIS